MVEPSLTLDSRWRYCHPATVATGGALSGVHWLFLPDLPWHERVHTAPTIGTVRSSWIYAASSLPSSASITQDPTVAVSTGRPCSHREPWEGTMWAS